MRLINQSYEILGTPKSLYEAWNFVAMAARNCYQSHKSKPDESEEQFCRRLLLKHEDDLECDHLSPFEFGVIYLTQRYDVSTMREKLFHKYINNPYSRVTFDENGGIFRNAYITTNLRVILENHWEDDLKYVGKPTEHHVKACCFKLITNRAIMCELTRHRSLSFCVESTRYCNYSSNKFGNELTFIQPCWLPDGDHSVNSENILLNTLNAIEKAYNDLVGDYWKAQQAATILPNALKTTIMMCGYEDNLQHMFRLRAEECSGSVHPQMKELMVPMYESYKEWKSMN